MYAAVTYSESIRSALKIRPRRQAVVAIRAAQPDGTPALSPFWRS